MVQNSKGTNRYAINNLPALPHPAAIPQGYNVPVCAMMLPETLRTGTSQCRCTESGFSPCHMEGSTTHTVWHYAHSPVRETVYTTRSGHRAS